MLTAFPTYSAGAWFAQLARADERIARVAASLTGGEVAFSFPEAMPERNPRIAARAADTIERAIGHHQNARLKVDLTTLSTHAFDVSSSLLVTIGANESATVRECGLGDYNALAGVDRWVSRTREDDITDLVEEAKSLLLQTVADSLERYIIGGPLATFRYSRAHRERHGQEFNGPSRTDPEQFALEAALLLHDAPNSDVSVKVIGAHRRTGMPSVSVYKPKTEKYGSYSANDGNTLTLHRKKKKEGLRRWRRQPGVQLLQASRDVNPWERTGDRNPV